MFVLQNNGVSRGSTRTLALCRYLVRIVLQAAAAVSKPRNISQDLRSAVIGVNHTKAALFRDAKAALWIGGFF